MSPTRPLERLSWFEGSPLLERDLAAAVTYESRLLELHVRGVHDTWGVAQGLTLTVSDDAREVLVSPGFAYTCRGDALILASLARTAPPGSTTAAAFDLALAPATPPETLPCERPSTCTGETVLTRAVLRWELASLQPSAAAPPLAPGVRLGDEIPLGRVLRLPNGLLAGPVMTERRVARGLVRPHIAFGVTRPGELVWSQSAMDLSAWIDTSAAGFSGRPLYFATLGGAVAWPAAVLGPLVSLGQATSTSFRLRLMFATSGGAPPGLAALRTLAGSAAVSWVGVEPVVGCPPTLTLLEFLALGISAADVAAKWSGAFGVLTKAGP